MITVQWEKTATQLNIEIWALRVIFSYFISLLDVILLCLSEWVFFSPFFRTIFYWPWFRRLRYSSMAFVYAPLLLQGSFFVIVVIMIRFFFFFFLTFFRCCRCRRRLVVLSLFIRAGVCFMYETEIFMYTAQSLCNLMLHMGHISMKYFCHILCVLCVWVLKKNMYVYVYVYVWMRAHTH